MALLIATGCGYQFAGESSFLPKDIRTIYVEPFINRSRDVGLEKELASGLRSEIYRRQQLQLVDQAEKADVILTGVIRSLDSSVASVNRRDEVLQYESVLTVDVTLRRREPNEILWRGPAIRLTDLYAGSRSAVVTTSSEFRSGTLNTSDVQRMTDIQLTEAQTRESREQLMERFARELHQRLMEMF
ncbi:MAG: LPS assembly lipoprotein LptE [bacterium]|nr:LPS assembly lipoprotein LptE [bacterium]